MNHPGIARVFDGGITGDGRPYFVMELVDGEPITQFCDRLRLPIGERIALLTSVCRAVQHAHQKGVIHRDLKPSNVLVTLQDGTPAAKVIDFGIAKAVIEPLTDRAFATQAGQWIGTPAYMSPEQLGLTDLDIDTRSDIYSLGIVLYELLAGVRPYEERKTPHGYGVFEELRAHDAPPPSTRLRTLPPAVQQAIAAARQTQVSALGRQLSTDLGWIISGADHSEIATVIRNQAAARERRGDLAGAESLYRESLSRNLRLLGEKNAATATAAAALGKVLLTQRRFGEAEAELMRARTIREQALGPAAPLTVRTIEDLATLYDGWGKPERAAAVRAVLPSKK